MSEKDGITTPRRLEGERDFDVSLRPTSLAEFVGQERLKENLGVFIQAARQRGEALDHCLFCGPPGLGKTTLAYLLAHELGVDIRSTSGPVLEKPYDLAGLLTGLKAGDILFIDEIHRLGPAVEEYLYPAMEEFALDIVIDRGPHARSVKLNLNQFTLVGATTRAGLLTGPLRSRFGVVGLLSYYTAEEILQVVRRSARLLSISVEARAAEEIARRSRGTPRVANRLLRRVRDFAQVKGDGTVTGAVVADALTMLEVDPAGLDGMDTRILETLIEKFGGGPVGIGTLAVAVGEEGETLEEVYEPFLIQVGFLERTPRGRKATARAYEHLGKGRPPAGPGEGTGEQEDLFGG